MSPETADGLEMWPGGAVLTQFGPELRQAEVLLATD
jgi:hypothetical protein